MRPINELLPWFISEQDSCQKRGLGHVPPALRNLSEGAEEDDDKAAYLSTLITILQDYKFYETHGGAAGDITISIMEDLVEFLVAEKEKHREKAYEYVAFKDKWEMTTQELDAMTSYFDAEIYVRMLITIAKSN